MNTPINKVPINAGRDMLRFADQCIIMVEGSSDSLRQAYEWIKFSASERPMLRNLLLVCGVRAESYGAFVFEKFHEMAAHFLGYELEFFGWMSKEQITMNWDSLFETKKSSVLHFLKTQLHSVLSQPEQIIL